MKKLSVLLCALVLMIGLVGCGSKKEVINVYNYGKYIDPNVINKFEEEFDIKVNYENYETNEEMYQKIKAGASNYDVIFPSEYMVERMAEENLLTPLNHEELSDYGNIMKSFLNPSYDEGNQYSVPYFWGTLGILYNSTMVTEPVNSWDILWKEEYKGNILMQNSMRDAFAVSLKSLGYSLNTKNDAELEEAKAKLIKQVPLVYAYVVDQAQDEMIAGNAALAVIYSGEAFNAMNENPDLRFAIPDPSNIWVDNMCIPKTSANVSGAHKFINYMLRGDVAHANSEYVGYPNTNQVAYDTLTTDEMKSHPAFYPENLDELDLEFLKDLGDYNKVYDKMWTEVLSNN